MPTVNPECDVSVPGKPMWFVQDPNGESGVYIEAPSIRELLRKLGRGYKAENYFPSNGVINVPGVRSVPKKKPDVIFSPEPEKPIAIPKVRPIPRKVTSKYAHIYHEVMDMWFAGVPTREIAAKFNVSINVISSNLIDRARRAGDSRAISRQPFQLGISRNAKPRKRASPIVPLP